MLFEQLRWTGPPHNTDERQCLSGLVVAGKDVHLVSGFA